VFVIPPHPTHPVLTNDRSFLLLCKKRLLQHDSNQQFESLWHVLPP
jgi:hypothetical protein